MCIIRLLVRIHHPTSVHPTSEVVCAGTSGFTSQSNLHPTSEVVTHQIRYCYNHSYDHN
jgi:hypothetical protein